MEFVGIVKTAHSKFPKAELETIMSNWPGGSHMVMERVGSSRPDDTLPPLFVLGYKYNSRKVISFICTKEAGSTELGEPYVARFLNGCNNVEHREVDRPKVASTYFNV